MKYFFDNCVVVQALNTLGFNESEQNEMFRIWSAILHLGNVQITESMPDDAQGEENADSSFINVILMNLNFMDVQKGKITIYRSFSVK